MFGGSKADVSPASAAGASDFQMELPDEKKILANPYIMYKYPGVAPLSFCDSRQDFETLTPPPKYFTDEQMITGFTLSSEKAELLRAFAQLEDGGLIFTDQEALDKQKGVLSHIVKQAAITLLKGLALSHISLPIKIFEPTSTLARMADLWT